MLTGRRSSDASSPGSASARGRRTNADAGSPCRTTVGTEVAMSAGTGLSGDCHRTGVTRVAGGAVTNRAVVVGFSDAVTLLAAAGHRRWPFQSGERMWRALDPSRLVSLGEIYLFRSKCFVPAYRSPRHCGVPAAQKLLIDIFMATSTVASSEAANNGESVVRLTFLSVRGLMAVEAIDPFLCVFTHFIFMNNRILSARMAISALSRSAYEVRFWLFGLNTRTCAVDQKCGQHQREGN